MNSKFRAYLYIHIAVLLFGFTGILGKLIDLPKGTLVWWRMLLTTLSLLFLPGVIRAVRKIPAKDRWALMGIGGIVAIHWVTFFLGIELSSVSVALTCMATTSFFTAVLEPLILRTRIRWIEVFVGILVFPGILLVHRSSDFPIVGIIVTLISALLAAVFAILNKKMVDRHNSIAITFVELGSGWLVLCVLLPFYYIFWPDTRFFPTGWDDWVYMLLLAFACTSFAYVISLLALKELTPFTVNLTINLEPIYSIILAFFIFGEHKNLSWTFYPGAGLILLAVFSFPFIHRIRRRKKAA